jgi:hypothetical protein
MFGLSATTSSRVCLDSFCPEMTSLTGLVRSFAALLQPEPANEARLRDWAETARSSDLPDVRAFARGVDLDIDAAIAAVTPAVS